MSLAMCLLMVQCSYATIYFHKTILGGGGGGEKKIEQWLVGIEQWLDRRACNQKVLRSSPSRRIFFLRVNFLC